MRRRAKRRWRALITAVVILSAAGGTIWYFTQDTPQPSLELVSGTEYISGEEGQIIIRLSTQDGPITNASCKASLLFPDKSYVFIDRTMQPTSVEGNYYVSFTTPTVEGVYEERIKCSISEPTQQTLTTSDSFHVSPGLNMVREMSISQRRQYEELSKRINTSQQRLQQQIENVTERVVKLEEKTQNITENVEEELNKSIREKFKNLSNGFAKTARAMEQAFSTQ